MEEILNDAELMADLQKGRAEVADGHYSVVE